MTFYKNLNFNVVALLFLAILLSACRGQPTENTQIQPQQNMYWQQKFKAFEPNDFFEDRRAMRLPVENTVARGHLRNDIQKYEGVNPDGSYVERIPIQVTRELLDKGRVQYNISCTPCHGVAGLGDGLVISRGYVPPPSFLEERILAMPDGEIYSAIYNGAGSMPSYRNMVKRADERWAIVAYIRAMQVSQGATEEDLRTVNMSSGLFQTDYSSDLASE
ncbi:MAG: cytochrome c [Balneolales bacterium]|nr:cytochrome c [Balneolales bacterium]